MINDEKVKKLAFELSNDLKQIIVAFYNCNKCNTGKNDMFSILDLGCSSFYYAQINALASLITDKKEVSSFLQDKIEEFNTIIKYIQEKYK